MFCKLFLIFKNTIGGFSNIVTPEKSLHLLMYCVNNLNLFLLTENSIFFILRKNYILVNYTAISVHSELKKLFRRHIYIFFLVFNLFEWFMGV